MKLYKTIIMLLLATVVLPIKAQNIIHPKIAGPNGLWVNSYNGVLFFGQTDMETQNTAMPMSLRFYYNSSHYATNYGYGMGFSLGYEMRYTEDEKGNVTIESGDGRCDTFTKYDTDYEAPAGVFSELSRSESGTYTLKEKNGVTYTFADTESQKLTGMTDRQGNQTELTYTNGMLTQIRDAVGHIIYLNYTDDLLTSASASFHNGTIRYEYNSKKCLRKRTDAMGNSTLYAYDDNNRLETITDANGHKTMIAYTPAGMCSRIKTEVSDKSIRYEGDKTIFIDYTEPKNLYSYYRWDKKGRVIEKVGLCCGIQSKLEYDDDDNVVRRTDANGNITSYTYDDRGNMLSLTDALGNTERYTYDNNFNYITSFSDKNGNTYRYTYDSKGNLTSFDGPSGVRNAFTYNDKGWLLTSTDASNNVARTTFNADGTMASVMDAAGHTTFYTYDQCGNITTITDGRNNSTNYSYDDNNRIISQTDALGNTTSVSYDKVGNIVRIRNAKNQISAYTYDAHGNILSMTNPQGGIYTYTYDGRGNLLSVTDPIGSTQTYAWNEKNKIQSETNGEGERTNYDYDAKGNLTAVFQPNGNVLNFFYDKVDRISQVSDNIGIIAKYTYDGNGNRLTATDGMNRTVTYTYDALNRRITESQPSGSTIYYSYDANSNLITITDASGSITNYSYNNMNQIISFKDAINAETKFEYDANGNLLKVTDAKGNTTTYTYNAVNRNTDIAFANGTTQQYGYDELGQIIISKDRSGNSFKYTYDATGNLLCKTYPNGTTDKYTYDAVGRMLSAVNSSATVNFTYDRNGRLLTETLNGKTTKYSYDVALGKRSFTYPSGLVVVEQLNARDLITSILKDGNEVVTMAYNTAGQKTQQTYANGIITRYTYNENGWSDSIKANHNLLNFAMEYDAIGNITLRKDLLDNERTESYGYDVICQLTSFRRGSTVAKSYQFDLLGNRTKALEGNVTTTYSTNNTNAYTAVTGELSFTLEYDSNGNLLRDATNKYDYDYNSRLILANGSTYNYDALGRRISKDNTNFYYAGDQVVEEMKGNEITSYLFGNDVDDMLLMQKNEAVYYYTTNHLGSVINITDNTGSLVEHVDYDAYGLPVFTNAAGDLMEVSSIGNRILFAGREYDAETGLYYYRTRTMHPGIGRFMQKDPTGYIDGMNDYAYVGNSPVMYIDPSGLFTVNGFLQTMGFEGCPEPTCGKETKFGKITSTLNGAFNDWNVRISAVLGTQGKVYFNQSASWMKTSFSYKGRYMQIGKMKLGWDPSKVNPGRGWKGTGNSIGRIGTGLAWLSAGIQGMDLVRKVSEGKSTWCDWADAALTAGALSNPWAGAVIGGFQIGWDFGTWFRTKTKPGQWLDQKIGDGFGFLAEKYYTWKYDL